MYRRPFGFDLGVALRAHDDWAEVALSCAYLECLRQVGEKSVAIVRQDHAAKPDLESGAPRSEVHFEPSSRAVFRMRSDVSSLMRLSETNRRSALGLLSKRKRRPPPPVVDGRLPLLTDRASLPSWPANTSHSEISRLRS